MNNEKIKLRNAAEREFRSCTSAALFNNLCWWADGTDEVDDEALQRALSLIDEIFLNDFKDEFVVTIPKGTVFHRARILEEDDYKRLDKGIGYSAERLYGYNWEESKEPPAEKAKENRVSREKEVALYLASDEITACSEIKPPIRRYVSVAKFISTENIQAIDFSKLEYSRPLDINDEKYDADARQFLQKILSLFTVPVGVDDLSEYRVTQKIVDCFRKKNYKAFIYRSFYTNGNNYAFFDDSMKHFQWIDSRVLIHYATASLFVSMDKLEEHKDIHNANKVEQEVRRKIKDEILKKIKNKQCFREDI